PFSGIGPIRRRRVDVSLFDAQTAKLAPCDSRRYSRYESLMNVNRRTRKRIVRAEKPYLELIQVRIAHFSHHPRDLGVNRLFRVVVDLFGRDVEIPSSLFTGLHPEGGADRDTFRKPRDEFHACVDLFDHQWPLIHVSTPFALSVTAMT